MPDDYGFPTTIIDTTRIGGATFRRLFGVIESQVPAALSLLGAGVISGLQVSILGGVTLSVSAGRAVAYRTAGGIGYVALETDGDTVDLPDDTETGDVWYVFAAIRLAEEDGDVDSRESGAPSFVVQDSDTLDGGALLAKITVTADGLTIVDRRSFIGSSALVDDLYDNGRIVGADFTAGAPELPAVDDLSIVLPSGGKWLVQERRLVLAADVVIDTVPPSGSYFGFLSIDPDTDEPTVLADDWYSTYPTGATLTALQSAGKPCLGKVTTDTDAVTAIDSTTATGKADLIYTQAGLLTFLGSGDGESGPAYWGALAKSVSDTQTVEQFVTAQIDALRAELTATIQAGGARPRSAVVDALVLDNAITRDTSVALLPTDGERHNSAFGVVTVDGVFGDGSGGYPTYFRTDLDVDLETGVITP